MTPPNTGTARSRLGSPVAWAGGARRLLAVAVSAITLACLGAAGDWPQWRYDANRSGATPEAEPAEHRLQWQLTLDHPDPAYDHQYRMCADVTYAPIAAEGVVYIPSNVTDQVMACDLSSGMLKWRFTTEGPVRFAPVYHNGKVCFGSDDGFLYCVSARDGTLRWKVRGAPERLPDCRMLVNGRLCSRWPARGAPVVHDGVLYFGAGIWPEEGVYVCAVDPETGRVLWRSDSMSYIKNGMSDHGRPYDLSLPPQGYLAVIDGKLAVPSGRALAAWLDPATGTMEPYTCFYSKTSPPRGTWYVSGIGQYCVQGGNWFGTRQNALPAMPAGVEDALPAIFWSRDPPDNELYVVKNRPFFGADTYNLHNENLYTEPVFTATTLYTSEFTDERKYLVPRGHTHVAFPDYDRIVARDLTKPEWKTLVSRHIRHGNRKVKMAKMVFPVLWELESPLRVLIKGGRHLYAAGKDTIAAIAIPATGEDARVAWEAAVDGTPVQALVTDRKLVVVTHNGNVSCFGAGEAQRPTAAVASAEEKTPYTSPKNGFACLLGWGDGTRARALALEHGYRVLVFEPDAATALQAGRTLADAGLYGRRVQIVTGTLADIQITPYWATRIMAESEEALTPAPERILDAALHALRPFTGQLQLPADARWRSRLEQLLARRDGYALSSDGGHLLVRRTAPPTGAADWTHEAGGAHNCFASPEQLVKWPLGVLWYSGDIDRYFTPASHFQHERHPYPLVSGGRMFIITGQLLHAVDIYTGSYLWQAEMPMTPWIRTRSLDSRIYGRPTERNCAVADDWVYAITGEKVHAYDVATGELIKVFDIPEHVRNQAETDRDKPQKQKYQGSRAEVQAAPQWTEFRVWRDLLLALLGRSLVAIDRHTGDVRWTRPSTRETTTCAIGEDTLFGLDCDVPEMGGGGADADQSGLLFAADPATGEMRWQKPFSYAPVPAHEVRHPRLWMRPVIPVLAYNAKHSLLILTVNRAGITVLKAADGAPVWSKPSPAQGNLQNVYPPVVTDDYLVLSNYKGCFGYLLDVMTGKEAGETTGIPRPRTCARIIGNNNLLVYRDAATELYDIDGNRMIGLNSLRSGCTTSFIPAGGIMTAPMLGHGCVCNYPMFASLGLYHWPAADMVRPEAVKASWRNQAAELLAAGGQSAAPAADSNDPFATATGSKPDTTLFQLINCTLEPAGSAVRLSVKDKDVGYAVRAAEKPLRTAGFSLSLKRVPGTRRHGNAFFVCGKSNRPEDWAECRLYYGGRSSLMITGGQAQQVEQKIELDNRTRAFTVTVRIDCNARSITFEAAGHVLTSTFTGPIDAITHYGYGGGNSDNFFTDIALE